MLISCIANKRSIPQQHAIRVWQAGSGGCNSLGEIPLDVHLVAIGHHGQEHFIGTKAAIPENLIR